MTVVTHQTDQMGDVLKALDGFNIAQLRKAARNVNSCMILNLVVGIDDYGEKPLRDLLKMAACSHKDHPEALAIYSNAISQAKTTDPAKITRPLLKPALKRNARPHL